MAPETWHMWMNWLQTAAIALLSVGIVRVWQRLDVWSKYITKVEVLDTQVKEIRSNLEGRLGSIEGELVRVRDSMEKLRDAVQRSGSYRPPGSM